MEKIGKGSLDMLKRTSEANTSLGELIREKYREWEEKRQLEKERKDARK